MILTNPYLFKLLDTHYNPAIVDGVNNYIVTEYGYMRDSQLLKLKNFTTDTGDLKPVVLYGKTSVEKDIPPFNHPLLSQKNNWLALDLRPLVRLSATGKEEVRNESDYSLAVSRFILSGLWISGKQQSLYALKLPHVAFAEWLSTNLTRKFGLNITDQVKLFALASIYYATLFIDEFVSDDLAKLKIRMANEIFVESVLDDVFTSAGMLNNVDDFCTACYKVTGSVRLKGMTFGVLVNVLANNWFSTQGAELPMLSLQHPPTWISMVTACLTSKTYRNSYISKVVETKNKRGAGDEFLKNVTAITQNQLSE